MLKKLLLCSVLMGAATVFATAGVSDEAVKIFGSEEAKERVSKGALFIDGEFVRGPYSVTREGNVILVNGKIASRFTVKVKADEPEPEVEETEDEAPEETAEEEVSTEGSDDMPTLDDSDFSTPAKTTRTSTIEKKLAGKSGGIEAKLAAQKKKKELKQQSKGTFNTGRDADGSKTTYDPEALFEEADYTYTQPSKPEPPAVPYIRPEAQLSAKERAERAKAKDAEIAARGTARDEAEAEDVAEADEPEVDNSTEVADSGESFEGLSDADAKRYTAAFNKRRDLIERSLKMNRLVLLSAASSGMKTEKQPIMWRFMQDLPTLCDSDSATKLISKWGTTVQPGYLKLIHENRKKNEPAMKTIINRIKREAKAAKERSRNRI